MLVSSIPSFIASTLHSKSNSNRHGYCGSNPKSLGSKQTRRCTFSTRTLAAIEIIRLETLFTGPFLILLGRCFKGSFVLWKLGFHRKHGEESEKGLPLASACSLLTVLASRRACNSLSRKAFPRFSVAFNRCLRHFSWSSSSSRLFLLPMGTKSSSSLLLFKPFGVSGPG